MQKVLNPHAAELSLVVLLIDWILQTNSTVTTSGLSSAEWVTAGSSAIMMIATVVLAYYAYTTIQEGKKDRRKTAIARQLEGLYNPLYVIVKYVESISRDKKASLTYLAYGMDNEEARRGQRQLDEIILRGSYLADDKELEELLPRIVHAGFYHEANTEQGRR